MCLCCVSRLTASALDIWGGDSSVLLFPAASRLLSAFYERRNLPDMRKGKCLSIFTVIAHGPTRSLKVEHAHADDSVRAKNIYPRGVWHTPCPPVITHVGDAWIWEG